MAAYLVALLKHHDRSWMEEYSRRMPALEARFGGSHIAVGDVEQVEGAPTFAERLVIMQFPALESARAFYGDPDYQPMIELRQAGATCQIMLVDGMAHSEAGRAIDQQSIEERKATVRAAVDGYFDGLAKKDFDLIPFADDASLRAPLAPGGVHRPIVGRESIRAIWWQPLPGLLGEVIRTALYFDDELTGAVAEAEVEILVDPPVRLRVADRFTVDDEGRIAEQENHFDPRDVTNPGWQTSS